MNVFFEESGGLKAGSVLSRQGDALQVELPGGRRAKVRAKDVLFEFDKPSAAELMQEADAAAQQIDLDFLWECAPSDEFPFASLANEYFGVQSGPVERAALVLRMQGSPVYFRRKGRGQFQRAPEEQLKMALAALERKRQQALVQAQYEEELKAGQLPEALRGKALILLTKPDKNSIEYKALEGAAAARGISQARLMLECGGVASARALHEARFLSEHFPHGTGFPPVTPGPAPTDLPTAHAQAFSIDDITTTEIDDAFSVEVLVAFTVPTVCQWLPSVDHCTSKLLLLTAPVVSHCKRALLQSLLTASKEVKLAAKGVSRNICTSPLLPTDQPLFPFTK